MSEIKKKTIKMAAFASVIVMITVTVMVKFGKEKEPEITNTFIENQLETSNDYVPAKMIYNGLVRYEDGTIPFLTKKAFTMTYCAEVEMRLDLSKVKAEVEGNQIVLTVPDFGEPSVTIAPDSIQFYDEKAALFNWEEKADGVTAMQHAKEDVKKKEEMQGLEKMAKEQTEALLMNLIGNVAGEKEVVIVWM